MHCSKHGPTKSFVLVLHFHWYTTVTPTDSDIDKTNLPESDMVPTATSGFDEVFQTRGLTAKSLNICPSRNSSTSWKSNNKISSLDYDKQHLPEEGISEKSWKLILSSSRKGTNTNYLLVWNKWASWYDKETVDPFRWALKWVLSFAADLYEQNYEYRTVIYLQHQHFIRL